MASLDDILTTQKNGVQAINAYVNAINTHAGTVSTKKIAASTTQLVKTTSGWLASVSIITTGDTVTFYDSNSIVSTALTNNEIAVIPGTTLGVVQIQIPFATGLVMKTGTPTASATYT
jgi:precorrin-6B methylase 1